MGNLQTVDECGFREAIPNLILCRLSFPILIKKVRLIKKVNRIYAIHFFGLSKIC